ncbi:uncharacterized protein DS421_12g362760 [Arachis hypogaea]|nr:uncharacterized protein DS421_12g362760 [Arachis hypogaea]
MLQIIMNPTRRDWRPQPNNLIVPETTATTLLHQSSILIGFGARPHLNRNKNRVYELGSFFSDSLHTPTLRQISTLKIKFWR